MGKQNIKQMDWDKEIVAPITLKMQKGLWEVFKECVPRKEKLNDAVVRLIGKFVIENTEPATQKEIEAFMKNE